MIGWVHNLSLTEIIGIFLKHLLVSLFLCFCLITQSVAARQYNNDWRSMPFIQMMVAMMKAMNNVLGGSNSFAGMSALPYSPAFMPGMTSGMNSLGGFNNLPMSPAGMNSLPFNSLPFNSLPAYSTVSPMLNSFQTGQNTTSPFGSNISGSSSGQSSSNFWDPDSQNVSSAAKIGNSTLNGIWQALSGDVIAIYNNNRFLWSDGRAKNLAGHLAIKGNHMIAYIPAKNITLYFQFYMEPNQFVVRDQSARMYTFKRIH